MKGLVVS